MHRLNNSPFLFFHDHNCCVKHYPFFFSFLFVFFLHFVYTFHIVCSFLYHECPFDVRTPANKRVRARVCFCVLKSISLEDNNFFFHCHRCVFFPWRKQSSGSLSMHKYKGPYFFYSLFFYRVCLCASVSRSRNSPCSQCVCAKFYRFLHTSSRFVS